jgi:hypothetical protein
MVHEDARQLLSSGSSGRRYPTCTVQCPAPGSGGPVPFADVHGCDFALVTRKIRIDTGLQLVE